jgi:hypothetical protein
MNLPAMEAPPRKGLPAMGPLNKKGERFTCGLRRTPTFGGRMTAAEPELRVLNKFITILV